MQVEEEENEAAGRTYPVDTGFVLAHERKETEAAMEKRLAAFQDDETSLRIGVGFSGGGVRAASFACGVLRALAREGLMKQVSCLSAVSGGTYATTAFTSHVLEARGPNAYEGESLDQFYMRVVQRLEGRMCHNIGYLIRTRPTWKEFFRRDKDGSGQLPPCCDFPNFVIRIIGSLIFSPLLLMLYVVLPISIFMNVKNGMLLQASFCDPYFPNAVLEPFRTSAQIVGDYFQLIVVLTILFWAVTECLLRLGWNTSGPWKCGVYLTSRSMQQVFVRLSVFLVLYFIGVSIVVVTQWFSWGQATTSSYVKQACHCYLLGRVHLSPNQTAALGGHLCGLPEDSPAGAIHRIGALAMEEQLDYSAAYGSQGVAFISDGAGASAVLLGRMLSTVGDHFTSFASVERPNPTKACEAEEYAQSLSDIFNDTYMNPEWVHKEFENKPFVPKSDEPHGTFFPFIKLNAIVLAVSVVAMAWDAVLFRVVAALIAPLWATYLAASFTRWVVFGPVTTQYLFFGHVLSYTPENVIWVYSVSCGLIILSLPYYGYLQSSLHAFYRKSLQLCYYSGGKDILLSDASPTANCYCPTLVMGACVNDYGRPSDTDFYDDFVFTPFYSGGPRTGWWRTGVEMSKAMSMSGAALDAAVLINADKVWVRFIMSLLSLQMGNWIKVHDGIAKDWVKGVWRRILGDLYTVLVGAFHIFITVCMLGWKFEWKRTCESKTMIELAGIFAGILLTTAFLTHLPIFNCFQRSPIVLKIHLALQHHFTSERVPDSLYLSDGGLIECLGLVGLLRRRHRWMIVTDATATKDDPTFCLRQTIALAMKENICSFCDPTWPQMGLDYVFRRFRDGNEPFLHLRVTYDPMIAVGPRMEGNLFLIRMRRIDAGDPRRLLPVACCYTQCESEQCSPCCCCCGQFPDINNANQCFTPELYAALSGLGCELGMATLQRMKELLQERND